MDEPVKENIWVCLGKAGLALFIFLVVFFIVIIVTAAGVNWTLVGSLIGTIIISIWTAATVKYLRKG